MERTFSLWVKPRGTIAEELRDIIARLAKHYHGPIFLPHVTVLGSIPNLTVEEAKKKSAELAKKLRPYTLTTERLSTGKEFHRCIVIRMKRTEQVAMAFQAARAMFQHTDCEEYMPHLSIFYGNISEEEKTAAMEEVSLEMGKSFTVDTLLLVDTAGTPEAWKQITEFGFGQGSVYPLLPATDLL